MSLVQYSSSSEEIDNEEDVNQTTTCIVENKPKEEAKTTSISSFLPAPKNRQLPKKGPKVLGEAIRKVAGTSEVNPDNIVLEKSSRHVTSFIPSSLRNKQKFTPASFSKHPSEPVPKSESPNMMIKPEVPKLEIFQQVKSKPKPMVSKSTKIEVRPGLIEDVAQSQDSIDESETVDRTSKKRSHDEPDESEIKEFNVSQFYSQNMELKEKGLLEENKKLHTVTHTKNQLSALLKNAKQDEEVLSERIERNKRLKKERGNKYGW